MICKDSLQIHEDTQYVTQIPFESFLFYIIFAVPLLCLKLEMLLRCQGQKPSNSLQWQQVSRHKETSYCHQCDNILICVIPYYLLQKKFHPNAALNFARRVEYKDIIHHVKGYYPSSRGCFPKLNQEPFAIIMAL